MYLWGVKQLGGLHQWFFSFVKQWHHFKHAGCFYSFPFQMFCTKRTHAILQYHATVFSLKAFSIRSDFNPFLQTFDKKQPIWEPSRCGHRLWRYELTLDVHISACLMQPLGDLSSHENHEQTKTLFVTCALIFCKPQLNHIVNDDALVRDRVRGFAASTSIGAPPYHM